MLQVLIRGIRKSYLIFLLASDRITTLPIKKEKSEFALIKSYQLKKSSFISRKSRLLFAFFEA